MVEQDERLLSPDPEGSRLLQRTNSTAGELEVPLEQIRRYEDFSTVDWIQDSLHERDLRKKNGGKGEKSSISRRMDDAQGVVGIVWRFGAQVIEEGQNWVVVSLVGIAIGVNAALISIITGWLSDMKLGYCSTGWWLSRKFCCLELSDEGESCEEWKRWGVQPFRYIGYVLFAALFAFSAGRLVKQFAPYAAGSGISEIKCIIGGFIINGFLSPWTWAIKSLTLPLAIASGLQVGKEGPSVHVACAAGNVIGRMFRKYRDSQTKMREILTAASAAGVAVAFGSPIGGVLFAIEEMSHNFTNKTMWRSFVCALVATFTLSAMNPFRTGKLVLFQVSYDRDWHYFEIPFFIVLGIFGGLYGAFVIKFNLQVAAFRRKNLASHGIQEAVVLAVISGVVGYLNRFMRIDMTESLEILFKECEGGGDYNGLCQTSAQWQMVNSLLLATVIRTLLIIISYGCKVPAGIFVPSMAVGATFGRMVGIIAKALHAHNPTSPWFAVCLPDQPCITPGTYAFLGAAAALGGVTRITVTVVVIMFELTGALTYILPTMIVLLVTKAVSDFFGGGGISEEMIRFNGYPFLEKEDKEDDDYAFTEPIVNIMKKDLVVIRADGMPLQQIEEILQSTSFQGFPVVRNEHDATVLGLARKTEMRYAIDRVRRTRNLHPDALCTFRIFDELSEAAIQAQSEPGFLIATDLAPPVLDPAERNMQIDRVDFGHFIDQTALCVSPKLPLEIVMQMFRRMGPRVILVAQEGKLEGLVTVKDVLKHEAFHEHAHARRREQAELPTANGGAPVNWRDRVWTDDDAAGLEMVLEEVLKKMKLGAAKVNMLVDQLWSRYGGRLGGSRFANDRHSRTSSLNQSTREAGEEFELGEEEN